VKPSWLAACTLAAIGGFFLVLQAMWLAKIEPSWLPYPAQVAGALLAGIALASVVERRVHRAAMIAGVLGVGVLVVITYAMPNAFRLTAARGSNAAWILPLLVVGCGLACVAGSHVTGLARGFGAAMAAALVGACIIQLGGRIAYICGMPAENAALTVYTLLAAGISGALVAAACDDIYPRATVVGVLGLMAFALVAQLSKTHASLQIWDAIVLFGAPLAAGSGARIVQTTRK